MSVTVQSGFGFAAATQSDQESGVSTSVAVTPAVQHFHQSAAKAWCYWATDGTVSASYNITSVTDTGTGDWTVNIATDFSSANYAGFALGGFVAGVTGVMYNARAIAAGTFRINCFGGTTPGFLVDPTNVALSFVAFGDQA